MPIDLNKQGIQNDIKAIELSGHISTGELGRVLGFSLSRGFIQEELGVNPKFVIRKGAAVYWHVDQVPLIAAGLASYCSKFCADILSGKVSLHRADL